MEAFPKKKSPKQYFECVDLSRPSVQDSVFEQVLQGEWGYVHFGLHCKTWGPAGRLAGGTRRKSCVYGTGQLERETLAHAELGFMNVACCDLLLVV